MACISTIDIQTRLDVHELLSQFSHYLDHNHGARWAELFTIDGVFDSAEGCHLAGAGQLASIPGLVHERGHGVWRHIMTAIVIQRADARKELTVQAYCPVIEPGQNNGLASFFDFEFTLRFVSRWRISRAFARQVGVSTAAPIGITAAAAAAWTGTALQ